MGTSSEFAMAALDRYAPDVDVPPPAALDQVRRNLQLRVSLLREFGALYAEDVAELAGSSARKPGVTLDNWRRARRVATVKWHGRTCVPGFFLRDDGTPDPHARAALTVLAAQGFSDWEAALWWILPAAALDGARPVDLLLQARSSGSADVADTLARAARRPRDWF